MNEAENEGAVMECGCERPDDAGDSMGWHLTANHPDEMLAGVRRSLRNALDGLEAYIAAKGWQ